ncbi:MAG TPA: LLM class flavin-dependent oxidoreductase [Stellaceae bacterium]|nr:LLM class flavin-dependent oxidoreductase [Stellaceae bacterium]
MKFGVLQFFSWPERRVALPTVYARALQRIEIMERTGYDAVWLAEHHFTGYSVCPSVHMMGVHVADRTLRLRIGMAVSLAAFYHPLRLAEEVAFLDVLSGGRVNWGAGRGFDPVEFQIFGVPPEESSARYHEAVEIVHRAWTEERLRWSGRYWNFDGVEVLPKPMQQPHPPIWLACGSESSLVWPAERGYGVLLSPHPTFAEIAAHRLQYRRVLEASGHTLAGRDIPIARLLAVAESDAAAEEVARAGVQWIAGSYINPSKAAGASAQAHVMRMEPTQRTERYLRSVVIHGSPARVTAELERLREELPLDYLMIAPLSHASFMLFTEQVLPRFL